MTPIIQAPDNAAAGVGGSKDAGTSDEAACFAAAGGASGAHSEPSSPVPRFESVERARRAYPVEFIKRNWDAGVGFDALA